ncbi:lipid kinase [Rhodopseudomonas palustris]|uniref:lipid kinase n=1 Tax=Rhodopseudomonas palustris TaxID=1076 RepID=UPI002ACDB2B3|nr:lipid kinase [Rhodopseudomonas palustris]WQH00630.1 lipid kinase [Rhodopseudomonas palustris]
MTETHVIPTSEDLSPASETGGADDGSGSAAISLRRLLMVVNGGSRSGGEAGGIAESRLRAAGFDVLKSPPGKPDDLQRWIEAHADGAEAVVVAGGDGTLNAAAPALVTTGLPLGIIPAGTANDLARTLCLPLDIEAAADVIAAGHRKRIDLGSVNGHKFFNVASVGLSTELARELSGESKRRFGRLSYAITAAKVLSRMRPFRAVIVSSGSSVRVRTLQIAVGNGRYYGGGMAVEQTAEIDDARFDLYSLEFGRLWKLLAMAYDFRKGRHVMWREVRAERGVSFEIHTRKRRPINADGEIVTSTPARFEMLPKAVSVFVPKETPPRD